VKLSEYVNIIKNDPEFGPAFVHHRYLHPREAIYGSDPGVNTEISKVLQKIGINKLYRHQVDAIEHIRQGKNVLIATPTASGKSLIYNLTVLEALLKDESSKALYIFPLKALEQDQLLNSQFLFC